MGAQRAAATARGGAATLRAPRATETKASLDVECSGSTNSAGRSRPPDGGVLDRRRRREHRLQAALHRGDDGLGLLRPGHRDRRGDVQADPYGTYVDAVTGNRRVVTSGTLTVPSPAYSNLRAYVLDLPGNPAPGKVGTAVRT